MKGLVIKNTGSHYGVRLDSGEFEECRIKGSFRIRGIRTTNPVAVGDRVEVEGGYITHIEPRTNYIIRRASNLSKEAHIIAANIDQAVAVVTLRHPTTSRVFIDRFLATAEAYRLPAILVVNKVDLLKSDDDIAELDDFIATYTRIGYQVVTTDARTGEGLDELQPLLKDKLSLLSGNSGVGKSTLINHLIPGLALRTGDISAIHDRGMHTTTFSEMFDLPFGGAVIDTPGVKGFGTIDFERNEVGHFFPEIFVASADCRYGDCTHTHEPGCAVRAALEDGTISASRYNSYLSILSDSDSQGKYRAPQ